ncbi:hypothetical protein FQR65_LT01736 [Abscondita terminalis]|nr:hypothetical protein FQR65_LT01736 [Abscondita terminalis]
MAERIKNFMLDFSVAGLSSIIAKTVAAPIERTKLILQVQDSASQVLEGKTKKCTGIINCLLKITKEQGFFSLYRGNATNIIRYFPMQSLNFAFNEQFSSLFVRLIGADSLRKRFVVKSLSGGCAGALTVTILFPLEFCLTRIATDMGGELQREFQGLRDCFKKIMKKDGYRGFYYGYKMSVTGVALYRSLYFGLYDFVMYAWKTHTRSTKVSHPILTKLCLAQGVIIVASLSVYPLDTASRRKMLDSGKPSHLRLYKNNRDVYRTIYKKEGILGFYKGGLANCVRGMSGAIVLVMYDEIVHYIKVNKWITGCDNC